MKLDLKDLGNSSTHSLGNISTLFLNQKVKMYRSILEKKVLCCLFWNVEELSFTLDCSRLVRALTVASVLFNLLVRGEKSDRRDEKSDRIADNMDNTIS